LNDGIFFYWVMWSGWIYTTFLMKKDSKRGYIAFLILVGIILSMYVIPFSLGTVNASLLLFAVLGVVYLARKNKRTLYDLTVCFAAATTYFSIQIFSLYDPAKLFIDKRYIIAFFFSFVLLSLAKRREDLLFLFLIAFFLGDLLYQLTISSLQGFVEVGSMLTLDLFALTSMILIFMVKWVDMFKKVKNSSFKKNNHAKHT
jgi:hypothetical protein